MNTTCITMLRAINMTGHNAIKMSRLADLFRKIGYSDAETYIQSGNIVFTCYNGNINDVSSEIRKAIHSEFNLNIAVITRTLVEMKTIIAANPFLKEPGFDPSKMAVLFLELKPSETQIQKVAGIDYPPDRFQLNDSEIYVTRIRASARLKILYREQFIPPPSIVPRYCTRNFCKIKREIK